MGWKSSSNLVEPSVDRPTALRIFFLVLLVYFSVGWIPFAHYGFSYDCFYCLDFGRHVLKDPSYLLRPDYGSRFHPLSYWVMGINYSFFGLSPLGHGIVNLILHALIALSLYGFLLRWGASVERSLISSVAFLVMSFQWGVVFEIAQIWRLSGALFLVLSLRTLLRYLKQGKPSQLLAASALYFVSLAFGEEGLVLSLLLVPIVVLQRGASRARGPWLKKGLLVLVPFGVLAGGWLFLSLWAGALREAPIETGWHFLNNLFYFLKESLHLIFIPHADFVSGLPFPTLTRALPLLAISGFSWIVLRQALKKDTRAMSVLFGDRTFLLGCAIFVAAFLPYFLIPKPPLEEAWPPRRYLYLPGMGIALMLGAGMDSLRLWTGRGKRLLRFGWTSLAAYLALLALTTNVYLAQKADQDPAGARGAEVAIAFELAGQMREFAEVFPDDAQLIVENSPLSLERISNLLRRYYGAVGTVVGSEETALSENSRKFKIRWDGRLRRWEGPSEIP